MSEETTAPVSVVVLAAGRSARFGGDKLMAEAAGRPVIEISLDTFERSPLVERIVVVAPVPSPVAAIVARRPAAKPVTLVPGGPTRHLSERAGLEAVLAAGATELIAFHDAARPFVTLDLIAALVAAAGAGGAVPVLPATETLYRMEGDRARPMATVPVQVQTPQVFRTAVVIEAFGHRTASDDVDTAQTVARTGAVVAVVPGDERNLKLTHPFDLARIAAIARDLAS
ncbi:hypothetical protein BH24ACT7_BH24ACT7_04530 [soil metagenome]